MRSADVYEALSTYLAAIAAAAAAPPEQAAMRRAHAELARLAYQNLREAYALATRATHVELRRDDEHDDMTAANHRAAAHDDVG